MCLITVCFEQKVNFRTYFILHRLQPFTFHRNRDYNYTVFHQVHRLRKHWLTLRLCFNRVGSSGWSDSFQNVPHLFVVLKIYSYLYVHICHPSLQTRHADQILFKVGLPSAMLAHH